MAIFYKHEMMSILILIRLDTNITAQNSRHFIMAYTIDISHFYSSTAVAVFLDRIKLNVYSGEKG